MFNKDAIGRSKGYRPSGVLLRATKSMKGGERDRRAMEKDLFSDCVATAWTGSRLQRSQARASRRLLRFSRLPTRGPRWKSKH